jgi:hypothetical protein
MLCKAGGAAGGDEENVEATAAGKKRACDVDSMEPLPEMRKAANHALSGK